MRARGFCVACYYRKLRAGEVVSGSQTEKFRHRLTDVDIEARTAVCAACGPTSITPRDSGRRYRCRTDVNARSKAYKVAYRASQKAQMGDQCEVCGATERLRWDHDHAKSTVEYRGTLCNECNTGLGMFRDDPALLLAAVEYLRKLNI